MIPAYAASACTIGEGDLGGYSLKYSTSGSYYFLDVQVGETAYVTSIPSNVYVTSITATTYFPYYDPAQDPTGRNYGHKFPIWNADTTSHGVTDKSILYAGANQYIKGYGATSSDAKWATFWSSTTPTLRTSPKNGWSNIVTASSSASSHSFIDGSTQ